MASTTMQRKALANGETLELLEVVTYKVPVYRLVWVEHTGRGAKDVIRDTRDFTTHSAALARFNRTN